jgi:amino acid transporter
MKLKELLLGRPLKSEEERSEQLTTLTGIPVVGLDTLASAAYGPEAALTVLLILGNAASGYIIAVTAAIILLLFAVASSYRQTIPAYPQGGGAFTVARDNIGPLAGLLAASALCLDYVLNVAVAISAGVGALVSAAPDLLPFTLTLCLALLALMAIVNLRGVRSAGMLFMLPTYLFIACLGLAIITGLYKTMIAHGSPAPVVPPPLIPHAVTAASAWLLLRSFASGCTALSGVEAVSNAVPVFRKPGVIRARRTFTVVIAALVFLLAGIAILVRAYHIGPTQPGQKGYQSVLSQLIAASTGHGYFYYVSMAAVLMVLSLSANTSFTGFPRVLRALALDEYLPAGFAQRGRRLVYTNGILLLTLLSGILLIAFGGITDRLIPLFAVGTFTAFTMSQLGMVFHWRRSKEPHAARSMFFNAAGALATGVTLAVMVAAKFTEGAWLVVLAIPPVMYMFLRIRRYNDWIDRRVEEQKPLSTANMPAPIVVVPLRRLDSVTRKALRLALKLSDDIYAVQVIAEEMKTQDLSGQWGKLVEGPARKYGHAVPKLEVVVSPYREFYGPFLKYIKKLCKENKNRPIAVIIPELVEKKWYNFLFQHRATLLKELLLLYGGPQIVIVNAPWYIEMGKRNKFKG